MDLTRRRKINKPISGSLTELFPHDLQMYTIPPTSAIALEEFEQLAYDRLNVLRVVDQILLRENKKSIEDKRIIVVEQLKKNNFKWFSKLMTASGCGQTQAELQLRRRDHISHYILQLAYSRSEDLRRWFQTIETEIFAMRFSLLSAESLCSFLKIYSINFSPIPTREKSRLRECLYESTPNISLTAVDTTDFYRVPFKQVLNLVSSRRVYLEDGWAYIPSSGIITVITTMFKSQLADMLKRAAGVLPRLEQDVRLAPLLRGLHQSYVGRDYVISKNKRVTIDQLDKLSEMSFPLCMQQMHSTLRSNHHLRYGSRLQYGLFLKGIGLILEDALQFWRGEFTKIMDLSKFDKEYAYGLRHTYGQEGKRANYTPYSCLKIIMGNVGASDTHGCPFKHGDIAVLKQKMYNKIPSAGISEVADLVKQGHFQVACTRYFELTHEIKSENGIGINHPNQYFDQSQKLLAEKHGETVEVNPNEKSSTVKSEDKKFKPKLEEPMEAVQSKINPEDLGSVHEMCENLGAEDFEI